MIQGDKLSPCINRVWDTGGYSIPHSIDKYVEWYHNREVWYHVPSCSVARKRYCTMCALCTGDQPGISQTMMWHIYKALKCPNKVDQGKQCFFALFLDAQASLAPVFLPGLSIYQALRVSCLWLVIKSQQRNICHPGEKVSETNYEKCFRISLLQCTAVAQQRRQQNVRCLCYFIKKWVSHILELGNTSHCERVGHIKGIWQHQD